MSQYYRDEYTSSKRKKEKFMKDKIDNNYASHDKAKCLKDRDKLNEREK